MLHLDEAAKWLGMKSVELSTRSRSPGGSIPAFRINGKTVRYHPRTIIAKLAHDSGVPLEAIGASFGGALQQLARRT